MLEIDYLVGIMVAYNGVITADKSHNFSFIIDET